MRTRWLMDLSWLARNTTGYISSNSGTTKKNFSLFPLRKRLFFKTIALLLVGFAPVVVSAQQQEFSWTTFDLDTNKLDHPCVIVSGLEGLDGIWTFGMDAILDRGELILTRAEPIGTAPAGCRTDFMEISSNEGIIQAAILHSHNTTFANDLLRESVFNLDLSLDLSRTDNLVFLIDLAELRDFENNSAPEFDVEKNPGDFPKQLAMEYQLPPSNVPDVVSLVLPKILPDPEGDLVGPVQLQVEDGIGNLLFSGEFPGDTIDIPVPQTQGISSYRFIVLPRDEYGAQGAGLETTLTLTVNAAPSATLANWDNFNWNEANRN